MIDFKHVALPAMAAMEGYTICLTCSQRITKFVQLTHVEDLPEKVAICQPCINRMYVTACVAFNVRPQKLL